MKTTIRVMLAGLLAIGLGAVAKAEGVKISGYVDTTYNYSFARPSDNTNALRVFDRKANSFVLQNAEVILEHSSSEGLGGRVDLDFGHDAAIFRSGRNPATGDPAPAVTDFEVQQAYITYPIKCVEGLGFKAGKFVTLHGAEVIEAKDNFNVSRGILFGFAIPFIHTGAGLTYSKGIWSAMAAVVNGWDNLEDNNRGKTFHGMGSVSPNSKVSLSLGGTYGPEQGAASANPNGNNRSLLDILLTLKPTGKLTSLLNYDWGSEENVVGGVAGASRWWGIGLHNKYAFTDRCYAAGRYEYFEDKDASRTGAVQALYSVTGTLGHKVGENMEVRTELRYDKSSVNAFSGSGGAGTGSNNTTVALQWLYTFGG